MSTPTPIRDELAKVGYEFVQDRPRSGRKSASVAVAWAANADGKFVPWAAVGETASGHLKAELDLMKLARARDQLGTVDHYLVSRTGQWFKADPGMQQLDVVEGPTSPRFGGIGELVDIDLASAMIREDLELAARKSERPAQALERLLGPQSSLAADGLQIDSGARLPISRDTLWHASRPAAVEFARRQFGEHTSSSAVAHAVAQLVGSRLTRDLIDPFCGVGSFLWEAVDYSTSHGTGLEGVIGVELNQETAAAASVIGSLSPVPAQVKVANAMVADLPQASCVVSAPPFGMRGTASELLDGSKTGDQDLAMLDRALRLVAPGGRAVLHLPPGALGRTTGDSYRQFLSSRFRVAALLGLPGGAVSGSSVRSVLVVIEDAPPTDTFLALLDEDWESQLAPGGAALEAAIAHIDGTLV